MRTLGDIIDKTPRADAMDQKALCGCIPGTCDKWPPAQYRCKAAVPALNPPSSPRAEGRAAPGGVGKITSRIQSADEVAVLKHASAPHVKAMLLPADAVVRKGMPITTGVLDYFPLALAEVAVVSKAGNDQHNPDLPLHWARGKSADHADCIPRHLIDRGSRDADGMRHSAKLAWRALALLQIELEREQGQ